LLKLQKQLERLDIEGLRRRMAEMEATLDQALAP